MTGTLITLISIIIGIIAANLFAHFKKYYSFGLTGNTLMGVFGSVFFIKSFGRLGFDPWAILNNGDFQSHLFLVNCIISAMGSILGLTLIKLIYSRLNKEI